jgi:thymidylate synthase
MRQYLNVLQDILDNGVEKESGRNFMPNTIGISNAIIKMDLREGFPLLTTKKMYLRGVIGELLWFLRGDTNVKYLVDNNINIWTEHAYDWYEKKCKEQNIIVPYMFYRYWFEKVQGIDNGLPVKGFNYDKVKPKNYEWGDLGRIYGYQWRHQNGVDQVKNLIEGLKKNPYSRYHLINAWNAADVKDMALPPCHLLYQFVCEPKKHDTFYLDLNMYQRSCDTFLGVPFNIASMSLLLMIVAKTCNMTPRIATWIGGDTHIYVDHVDVVKEQLTREPLELPRMEIRKSLTCLEDIEALQIEDFDIVGYKSHPKLRGELFTGMKK